MIDSSWFIGTWTCLSFSASILSIIPRSDCMTVSRGTDLWREVQWREGRWWQEGGCGTRMLMRGTRAEKITLYNAKKPSRHAKYPRATYQSPSKPQNPSPKVNGEGGQTAQTRRMRMLRSVAQHQQQRWSRAATATREDAERPGSPRLAQRETAIHSPVCLTANGEILAPLLGS